LARPKVLYVEDNELNRLLVRRLLETRGYEVIEATDGMEITIGDNEPVTATLYQMTGHTPGSLAMIVPVRYQGTEHPILIITAGNAFNNINAFIGGYEHIWDIAIERRVENVMQAHPNTNMNLLARTAYIKDNYPPAINPLLYRPERTERYLNIVRACTRAWIAASVAWWTTMWSPTSLCSASAISWMSQNATASVLSP